MEKEEGGPRGARERMAKKEVAAEGRVKTSGCSSRFVACTRPTTEVYGSLRVWTALKHERIVVSPSRVAG